jgi:hypothetical protein
VTEYSYDVASFYIITGSEFGVVSNHHFEDYFKAMKTYKNRLDTVKKVVSTEKVGDWYVCISKNYCTDEQDGVFYTINTKTVEYQGNI